MAKRSSVEEFIAEQQEAAKRIITPATFRRFLELTIPPSVRGPSRRSLPSFKYSGAGGLTAREKRLAAGIEEPINQEVLDELVAGVRADEDEMLARHQAEMKRRRAEQQARAYSDRLITSIEAERAARSTLPSFAAGGTFGFTPQEVAGFGFPASVAASPTLAPAASPIASAAPAPAPAAAAPPSANSGFTPQQLAGFGFPSAAAARTPPTPVRQNSGFTPQQVAGFGSPPAQPTSPAAPGRGPRRQQGFIPQQVAGFGFPAQAVTPQQAATQPAASRPATTARQNYGFTPHQVAGFGSPPAQPAAPRPAPVQQQGFTPQQVAGFTSGPATYSPEVINEVMGLTPGQDQAFLGGQARFNQGVPHATLGISEGDAATFAGGRPAALTGDEIRAAMVTEAARKQLELEGFGVEKRSHLSESELAINLQAPKGTFGENRPAEPPGARPSYVSPNEGFGGGAEAALTGDEVRTAIVTEAGRRQREIEGFDVGNKSHLNQPELAINLQAPKGIFGENRPPEPPGPRPNYVSPPGAFGDGGPAALSPTEIRVAMGQAQAAAEAFGIDGQPPRPDLIPSELNIANQGRKRESNTGFNNPDPTSWVTDEAMGLWNAWNRASEVSGGIFGDTAGLVGAGVDDVLGTDIFEDALDDLFTGIGEGLIPTNAVDAILFFTPLPPGLEKLIKTGV